MRLRGVKAINLRFLSHTSGSPECEIRLEISLGGSGPVCSLGSPCCGLCEGTQPLLHFPLLPRQLLIHKINLQTGQPAQGQVIHGCRGAVASLSPAPLQSLLPPAPAGTSWAKASRKIKVDGDTEIYKYLIFPLLFPSASCFENKVVGTA